MFRSATIGLPKPQYERMSECANIISQTVSGNIAILNCALGGSYRSRLVLNQQLAREVDLDLFFTINNKYVNKNEVFEIADVLFHKATLTYKWTFSIKSAGYRVFIDDTLNVYIDITFLVKEKSGNKYILNRQGELFKNTHIIDWSATIKQKTFLAHSISQVVLNLKLLMKLCLPYQYRPSSTFIMAGLIPFIGAYNGDAWDYYRSTVSRLLASLSHGKEVLFLETDRKKTQVDGLDSAYLMNQFVLRLEKLCTDLASLDRADYCNWLMANCVHSKPIKIFVSSRQKELSGIRMDLNRRSNAELEFVLAEKFFNWDGLVKTGMDACDQELSKCDYFIGLYHRQYGRQAVERTSSPIEEEYMTASNALPDKNILVAKSNIDLSSREEQLNRFLERIQTKHIIQSVPCFTSPSSVDAIYDLIEGVISANNRINPIPKALRALASGYS